MNRSSSRSSRSLPALRSRLLVVPQSVQMDGAEPFDLPARWPLPADRVLFVFAAGIRAVKAPRRPLAPLDAVAVSDPRLRLLYVGPILDPGEGEALKRALAPRPWAHHVGSVPPAQMASLLGQADVVLNCSVSEGGMANSVLEALALERAVLVSDVPGNRALVEDEVTGLTFADDAELATKAERLVQDAALRARLGRAGRALVERQFPDRAGAGWLPRRVPARQRRGPIRVSDGCRRVSVEQGRAACLRRSARGVSGETCRVRRSGVVSGVAQALLSRPSATWKPRPP